MTNKNEKPKKWVIMIYAVANDKNSEEGMTNFFKELNKVGKKIDKKGSTAEVKILLQAYRNWGTTKKHAYYAKRFELKSSFLRKGRVPPDVVYTNLYTNMGDPNALSDFIVWCKNKYKKANHYMLLLWGHGAQYGMFTGEIDKKKRKLHELIPPKNFSMTLKGENEKLFVNQLKRVNNTVAKQLRDAQELAVTYKTKNRKRLGPTDTAISRKIINSWPPDKYRKVKIPPTVIYYFDVNKDKRREKLDELIPRRPVSDSLTIEEICKSLWDTSLYLKGSGNIDILMIFGCAMQTFELAYELNKCRSLGCKYLIASEELIYWDGYDYKNSFIKLLNDPGMNVKTLCGHIITDTEKKPTDDSDSWAVSCVDVQKSSKGVKYLNSVANQVMKLAEMLDKDSGQRGNKRLKWLLECLSEARLHCRHFGENSFDACYIDLQWFMINLTLVLERRKLFDELLRWDDKVLKSKYKNLIATLWTARTFFGKEEGSFVVSNFIGKNRSDRALWPTVIRNTNIERNSLNTSTGAFGSAIFFPMSKKTKDKNMNRDKALFFATPTDYNLEFELSKSTKNGWHFLVETYLNNNPKTRSHGRSRNGMYIPKDKNTEPSDWNAEN